MIFDDSMVLILAAGKGTRMYSSKPKVLLTMLDEPLLACLYRTLEKEFAGRIWTVVGHGAEQVRRAFAAREELLARFITQEKMLGTGHAVLSAWPRIKEQGQKWLLVLNGDTPLVRLEHLEKLLEAMRAEEADLGFLSLTLPDPGSFGRVVRADGRVSGIVEAKDYDVGRYGPATGEINAGIYCLRIAVMEKYLRAINNHNAAAEYYLTDMVTLAVRDGRKALALNCGNEPALLGLNTSAELVAAEEIMRGNIVEDWLRRGVLVRSPELARIGPDVRIEPGADLCGPCEIYGRSVLSAGVTVCAHTYIKNSALQQDCLVRQFSHLEGCRVGPRCVVGPFARLRPGATLERESAVGNFVELKKTRLGPSSKAAHLSYLGDADIGAGVNIGAGTITCNYDGKDKHKTVIEDGAFIGSNSALVAPVAIGAKALVGAGSVITEDVGAGQLALARGRQINRPGKQELD